jgi:hypothetical protein
MAEWPFVAPEYLLAEQVGGQGRHGLLDGLRSVGAGHEDLVRLEVDQGEPVTRHTKRLYGSSRQCQVPDTVPKRSRNGLGIRGGEQNQQWP